MALTIPSRIGQLIDRIEAGQPVTQTDVDRLATLQALDLAKAGEQFANEFAQRDAALADELRTALERP